MTEGQNVFSGLVHELSGFGEAIRQRDGQVIPAAEDIACVLLDVDVGIAALLQGPAKKGLHLLVDHLADVTHLRLGDPTLGSQGGD